MNPFKLSDHLTGDYKLVFDKVNLHATLRGLAPTTEYEDAMLALFDMLYEHLYRLFLWVFCMESLNFILDYFILETPYLKSNVTPYMVGLSLSAVITFIINHSLRQRFVRNPKLKPAWLYFTSFAIFIALTLITFPLVKRYQVQLPVTPTLIITGLYSLSYAIFKKWQNYQTYHSLRNPYRALYKQQPNPSLEAAYYKALHKQFKRQQRKGISSQAFYQRKVKDIRKFQTIRKWQAPAMLGIILIFTLSSLPTTPLKEIPILFLILCLFELPIFLIWRKGTYYSLFFLQSFCEEAAAAQEDLEAFFQTKNTNF